ncbi:MAG: beta-propeller domain-containing protein [Clostridia bacterium]|nr:beta-propeller domain-containing protein [Clostridia bacterium]
MKNKKLLRAMSLADEKYVAEADPRAMRKRPSWQRWTALAACICLLVTALNLVLFVPYDTTPPDVSRYEDSEYYSVIQSINALTFKKPKYKNNFQTLWNTIASIGRGLIKEDMMAPGAAPDAENTANGAPTYGQKYEETTDNQVAGVIEGDIFKRSDKYIYYMSAKNLYVYSIGKENSTRLFSCSLDRSQDEINGYYYTHDFEMYLSADCTTLTVIMPFYSMNKDGWARSLIDIVSLDVTDPADVRETNRITVTGGYLSSRVVDGQLMVMTNMLVQNPDFSKEETFLPQINSGNGFVSIAPENIMLPETLSSPRYTTVFMLDEKTLTPLGDAAFLSYSQEVYVSRDSIYATSQYTDQVKLDDGYTKTEIMTEIARLSYENDTLTPMGTTTVSGYVKDQYSLDEYEGVLRVVTTTNISQFKETITGGNVSTTIPSGRETGTSAALSCIDSNTWETLAKVENFAPKGETVESVRFDGDKAYVCTAVVVTLTDPVFFFDLSDLSNITVKDTGVIDGYSSSLVNWGDGYLLGIGFNDRRELKIEVYEEGETGVNSVTAYDPGFASFSQEYKAYFIDRENQLIGLGVTDYTNDYGIEESPERYIVLHFDGFRLNEVLNVGIGAYPEYCRATLIDGYMYILGQESFTVEELWQ